MLSVSWVIGSGANAQGGSTDVVNLDDVIVTLEKVLEKSGSITLDVVNGPEVGPESLQVESEAGLSVVSLGVDNGEDYVVRTYTNDSGDSEKITILGNEWDPKLVCGDESIVKQIVEEFFTTGDVSKNFLS